MSSSFEAWLGSVITTEAPPARSRISIAGVAKAVNSGM